MQSHEQPRSQRPSTDGARIVRRDDRSATSVFRLTNGREVELGGSCAVFDGMYPPGYLRDLRAEAAG